MKPGIWSSYRILYLSGWRSSRWTSLDLKVVEIWQDSDGSKTKSTINPDTPEKEFEDQVSSMDFPLTLNLPFAFTDTNAIIGMCC